MPEPIAVRCPKCGAVQRLDLGPSASLEPACERCGAEIAIPDPRQAPTLTAPPGLGEAAIAATPDDRQITLTPSQGRAGRGSGDEGRAEEPSAEESGARRRDAPTLPLPATGDESHPSDRSHSSHSSPSPAEEGIETVLTEAQPAAARYVEHGVIGRGGMGEIVLCIDRDIRRSVAMKRMLATTAADPSRRARFVEEAQVTGQLEHPNIVPVHELARAADGTVYFTMKLVKGRSLAEMLEGMKKASAGEPPLGKGGFPRTPSPKPLEHTSPAGSEASGAEAGPVAQPPPAVRGREARLPAGLGTRGSKVSQKSLEKGFGENLSSERSSQYCSARFVLCLLGVVVRAAFGSRGCTHDNS